MTALGPSPAPIPVEIASIKNSFGVSSSALKFGFRVKGSSKIKSGAYAKALCLSFRTAVEPLKSATVCNFVGRVPETPVFSNFLPSELRSSPCSGGRSW